MSNVYNIGLRRYRNEKIRVCDKDSIPLTKERERWDEGKGGDERKGGDEGTG